MEMNEHASTMMNQQQQQQQQMMTMNHLNQNQMIGMNQMNPQPQQAYPQMVMNRSYGIWAPPLPPPIPPPHFPNPNLNTNLSGIKPPPSVTFSKSAKPLGLGPRNNWKGKKVNKPNNKQRKDQQLQQKSLMPGSSLGVPGGGINVVSGGGNLSFNYNPPTLNELQHQNRLKARKFFSKKKFNKNNSMNMNTGSHNNRFAPFAPRNTTSFIIRAKKSGGIASLVSPYPVTPAVLPTPIFSPSREILVDTAKEEWGVDGYGSMKGLIRLRSPGHEMEAHEDDEEDEGGSSESDVEEHVEVERRLDHDLSRFEMIYNPNSVGGMEYHNVLENRVDDQDTHISQLEEENLILKDRLFLMERELGDMRRRLQHLERQGHKVEGANNEEEMENESENESESREEDAYSMEENNVDFDEFNIDGDEGFKGNGEPCHDKEDAEVVGKRVQNIMLDVKGTIDSNNDDDRRVDADKDEEHTADVEGKEEKDNYEFGETNEVQNIADVNGKEENNTDENKHVDLGLDLEIKGNIADVEGKEVKDNYELGETNKEVQNIADVNGKEENNTDENKHVNLGLEIKGNVSVEASEPAAVGGSVRMEDVTHVEDREIPQKHVED